MTSWRVTSSISSTFAFLKVGMVAIHWASSLEIPIFAELRLGLAGQNLDFLPNGVICSRGRRCVPSPGGYSDRS